MKSKKLAIITLSIIVAMAIIESFLSYQYFQAWPSVSYSGFRTSMYRFQLSMILFDVSLPIIIGLLLSLIWKNTYLENTYKIITVAFIVLYLGVVAYGFISTFTPIGYSYDRLNNVLLVTSLSKTLIYIVVAVAILITTKVEHKLPRKLMLILIVLMIFNLSSFLTYSLQTNFFGRLEYSTFSLSGNTLYYLLNSLIVKPLSVLLIALTSLYFFSAKDTLDRNDDNEVVVETV